MRSISFRKCTSKDVEYAIPLILQSGPEAFAYVLNNGTMTATDFLRHAFVRNGGEFSYSNHYVLLKGEEIIGTSVIFSAKKSKGFMVKDIGNIFRVYGLRSMPVIFRGLKIEKVFLTPKDNEYYIGHVTISKFHRSKGYGEHMMAKLMETIGKEKKQVFVLDVSEENPRAKTLYQKIGFIETKYMKSNLKSKFGYVPNHFRMEKER